MYNGRRPDADGLRLLEESLAMTVKEYFEALNGITSSSSSVHEDDRERTHDAEGSYRRIASDYASLVAGWSDVAESICASIPSSSSTTMTSSSSSTSSPSSSLDDNGETSPTDGGARSDSNASSRYEQIARYEDAVAKAQRHLESFESLRRSRLDAVLAATRRGRIAEEAEAPSSGGGPRDVLGRITSLIGGIFSSTGGSRGGLSNDSFDRSWKVAEGKSSSLSPTGQGGLADSHDAVVPQGDGEDIRIITLLYEHVLLANYSAYRLGVNPKKRSTDRSNWLLNRWISTYCSPFSTSSSGSADDPTVSAITTNRDTARVDPTLEEDGSSCARRIFHVVIRQNVDLHSMDGIKAAEDLLRRMRQLGRSGISFCSPGADSYNIVLLGYCHLCKPFHHERSSSKLPVRDGADVRKDEMSTRRFIVDGVVRVLSELAENADEEEENSGPNLMSMNLALNAIAKAGGSSPNDSICQTTNKLLFDLIGEEQYRSLMNMDDEFHPEKTDKMSFGLIGEEKYRKHDDPDVAPRSGTSKKLSPNLSTYHFLVDIYSNGASIVYTKRAMAILNKMIRIRSEQDSEYLKGDSKLRNTPASFVPSTGTHNKVLHALVEKMEDNILSEAAQDREKTAKEAMRLLDSMVLHGSSLPSPITFLFLLRLWQNTSSDCAGEYAEEILSRMEIFCLYQNEFRVLSNAYLQALECWLTAAKAGRPGAAERAFR
jgi:hypothetical protein